MTFAAGVQVKDVVTKEVGIVEVRSTPFLGLSSETVFVKMISTNEVKVYVGDQVNNLRSTQS